MSNSEYKVDGFSFSDIREYKEAKREAETIEYIKANTDLSDLNKAVKLYHKLVERKTLKTVVGFAFLKDLQERILKDGIMSKESIPGIRVEKDEKQLKVYSNALEHEQENKLRLLLQEYKIKLRNSRIISFFLIGIIIAMLLISIFSDRTMFSNYENEVLNKYAAWEEELEERERLLIEREKQLSSE